MARNKHPEETVNRILDVSYRLFVKKGYEHTSIQDIIDGLGGLSKGAIYHHFRSKEEILVTIIDRLTAESNKMLANIRDRRDLNGKEKLKSIFYESISRPVQNDIFMAAPNLGNDPKLAFSIIQESMDVAAPHYILPILEEGIRDGSIETDYPAELAELIILTANFWMNPMIFGDSQEKTFRKFMVFRQMTQSFGLDIIDASLLERLQELSGIYQKNK